MKDAEAKERLTMNMTGDIGLMREGIDSGKYVEICIVLQLKQPTLESYFPSNGIVLFDEIGRILEVVASLETEEKEWMIALLEEGKIVHDAKISFSFEEMQ